VQERLCKKTAAPGEGGKRHAGAGRVITGNLCACIKKAHPSRFEAGFLNEL